MLLILLQQDVPSVQQDVPSFKLISSCESETQQGEQMANSRRFPSRKKVPVSKNKSIDPGSIEKGVKNNPREKRIMDQIYDYGTGRRDEAKKAKTDVTVVGENTRTTDDEDDDDFVLPPKKLKNVNDSQLFKEYKEVMEKDMIRRFFAKAKEK